VGERLKKKGKKMIKKFRILPVDTIKGGSFQYELNVAGQYVAYSLQALYQGWLIRKTIDKSGYYPLNLNKLKSERYKVEGTPIKLAGLSGVITDVADGMATASLSLDGYNAHGVGQFSLKGEYVELVRLDVSGTYGPARFRIVAVQE
jgi:hypothetical protein